MTSDNGLFQFGRDRDVDHVASLDVDEHTGQSERVLVPYLAEPSLQVSPLNLLDRAPSYWPLRHVQRLPSEAFDQELRRGERFIEACTGLCEFVRVELQLAKGKEAAVVESVKAASDVYAPVSGTVTEGNAALEDDPALVNSAAETDGWFFRLAMADESELDELMTEAKYKDFVAGL